MKKALITGITGQDGFYLTCLLISKGYEVHGLLRGNSTSHLGNLSFLDKEIFNKIKFHYGDVTDHIITDNLINEHKFDEIYHLAGQSFVALSFKNPNLTYSSNIDGTLNIANAVKTYSPNSKLYFAASSELYGEVKETPQNEDTPFHPRSPYAISKLAGFWTIKNYRENYNLYMVSGILFNHESELRGPDFITRKVTMSVAKIHNGSDKILEIGNLNSKRDWGYAKDYVYGMWLMLQQEKPSDYVLGTGKIHSIRTLIENAFLAIGKNLIWEGEGINEIGRDSESSKILVKVNPEFFRPAEVELLYADFSKAKKILNWEAKTNFDSLIKKMVIFDIKLLNKEIESLVIDYN